MRKNTFLHFLLLVVAGYSYAQSRVLTLEDAVLKQRTTLAPQKLNQLSFIKGTNLISYIEKVNDNDVLESVTSDKGIKKTLCTMNDLKDKMLQIGGDTLKTFPRITWRTSDIFYFAQKDKVYNYNIKTSEISLAASIPIPSAAENNDTLDYEHIAFTEENNLYIFNGKESSAVTSDTDKGIVNGQAVHRNEFGITKGTFWSATGSKLAYYRMDETMVKEYPIIDWTKKPAAVNYIRYPMAGEQSHEVTICVYDISTGQKITLQTGEPKDQYLTNVCWSPDEQYIYVAVLSRDQNHMLLNCYNASTGEFVKTLFEEAHEKYVEPLHPMKFLATNPNQFIWQSTRNGWNHLYLYTTAGVLIRQLTSGTYDVTQVIGTDARCENLYFVATIESGITRQLCTTNIKTGQVKQLTSESGTHTIMMSESGDNFIDTYQSTTTPRNVYVLNKKGAKTVTLLQATNPLSNYDLGDLKIFTLKASDGTDLYCRMYTPPQFDANNPADAQYPLLVYLYSGPHVQLINNTWNGGGDLWFRYMAQKGYIVFSLDNRGSENRGMKFEQTTFRQLGDVEIEDQLTGIEYLKSLSYVDTNRMGIFGWSFGGFMTVSMMLKHPGIFKAAVAGGPVIDWNYYEIMYTERYMDTPQTNPDGYKNSVLTNFVKNLEDKLMIIHGTSDDVVVWQHSLNFIKACVDNNKQVDYFVYPGHLHNITGKDRAHLFQKITDYFDSNLKK